jgi:hypothetical protein
MPWQPDDLDHGVQSMQTRHRCRQTLPSVFSVEIVVMIPITHRRTGVRRERCYGIKHAQNPGMFCLGKLMVGGTFLVDMVTFRQKLRKGYDRVHILGRQITQDLSQSLFKGLFHHFSPVNPVLRAPAAAALHVRQYLLVPLQV